MPPSDRIFEVSLKTAEFNCNFVAIEGSLRDPNGIIFEDARTEQQGKKEKFYDRQSIKILGVSY